MVKQTIGRLGFSLVAAVSMLIGAGCAGTGSTFYLDLQQKQEPPTFVESEPVKIVIEPFEDRRAEKGHVGIRTHLWGGVTHFNVAGERPGDVIAQALADRLKANGWKNKPWTVKVASGATATNAGDADIVISGQILDFSANAKSRIFSTVVNTSSKLVITAKNLVDQSTTTRNIEGTQRETIVWFNEEDVQTILSALLQDGLTRYIADTTIDQKALRPAR
ncbi:MAG: hypothetical protein OEV08_04510 [Nitrospira sp.]|nr:hypothetical protein [Nitrospira sp.]